MVTCIIPMHPLNSDATAIKQDDAPPCYEAILIDSDKIDKSEFPLSRDIKERKRRSAEITIVAIAQVVLNKFTKE